MTGVGGRPEVIIEGSNDLKEGWKEYDFLYKPGNLYRPLPFIGMCTIIEIYLRSVRLIHVMVDFVDFLLQPKPFDVISQ